MAKEIHVAQATNFRGIVVSKRHLSFSTSIEGFEKLSRWMSELLQKHPNSPLFPHALPAPSTGLPVLYPKIHLI